MNEMRRKDKRKSLVIVIILLLIVIVGLLIFGYYKFNKLTLDYNSVKQELETLKNKKVEPEIIEPENNEPENNETTTNDKFVLDENDIWGGYGTVTVKGYAKIEKFEPYPGEEPSGTGEDYVYFNLLESDKTFKTFVNNVESAWALEDSIGLGCIIDNKIKYSNESKKYGEKVFEITKEDSKKIINSTKEKPITLKLTRLQSDPNYQAHDTDCFSIITEVKIIE